MSHNEYKYTFKIYNVPSMKKGLTRAQKRAINKGARGRAQKNIQKEIHSATLQQQQTTTAQQLVQNLFQIS